MEKKYFIEYIASSKRIQMREILKYWFVLTESSNVTQQTGDAESRYPGLYTAQTVLSIVVELKQ